MVLLYYPEDYSSTSFETFSHAMSTRKTIKIIQSPSR